MPAVLLSGNHAEIDKWRRQQRLLITLRERPDLLDQARATLREADAAGVIVALHCRTGNRVGPAWAAYRAVDGGVPLERAIAEARALRMVDPRLEAAVRTYVERRLATGS